jgi:hypothetical protein
MEAARAFQGVERDDVKASAALLAQIAELLAAKMVSWDLAEDDDTPVPTTAEAIRKEDISMVMEILNAWTEVAMGVKASLGKGSNSGQPFPEESIPMETS